MILPLAFPPIRAVVRRPALDRATTVAVIVGALVALPVPAAAQTAVLPTPIHHTAWITGRDLPIAGVTGLARTPDGYLWLGSGSGLVRFDGVRFVTVDGATVPELGSATRGASVPHLTDRSGVLWIRRADGSWSAFQPAAAKSPGTSGATARAAWRRRR